METKPTRAQNRLAVAWAAVLLVVAVGWGVRTCGEPTLTEQINERPALER